MYSNAQKIMTDDDNSYPRSGAKRTVMRGPGGDAPVSNYLRLVYDRDVDAGVPREFQELLDQLD